jgi:hypothetical protein
MMSRLNALIVAKFHAQKAATSNDQKCAPMTLLLPAQLRNISGGDGAESPKGSW